MIKMSSHLSHSDIHDIAEQPVIEVAAIPKSSNAIYFLPTFGLGVKMTLLRCSVKKRVKVYDESVTCL